MGKIDAGFEAMRSAFEATYNAAAAADVANLFAEDCMLLPPDGPVLRGREQVRAYYQGWFDQFEPNLKIDVEEVKVRGVVAVAAGNFSAVLSPRDGGEPLELEGKYLNISKPGDIWEITHHAWNLPIPGR